MKTKIQAQIDSLIQQAHDSIDFDVLVEHGLSADDREKLWELQNKLAALNVKERNKK